MRLLFYAILFAVAVYFLVRMLQDKTGLFTSGTPGRRPGRRPGPRQAPRIVAPDDDEDFLRDLDRRQRREREREDPES